MSETKIPFLYSSLKILKTSNQKPTFTCIGNRFGDCFFITSKKTINQDTMSKIEDLHFLYYSIQ
jgi:hypothetical protein